MYHQQIYLYNIINNFAWKRDWKIIKFEYHKIFEYPKNWHIDSISVEIFDVVTITQKPIKKCDFIGFNESLLSNGILR